jgi:hypothetical protein
MTTKAPESAVAYDATLNLQQRMLAVMSMVGFIPKHGQGPESQGSYPFARVEDIKDAVRDACVAAGVMMHVSMDGRGVEILHGTDRYDKPRTSILATVWGTLTFVNVDTPSERETVAIHGQGLDTQDKALSKATTSAVKYGLLNAFTIPTGDDPDAEGSDVPTAATQQSRPARRPDEPPPYADDGVMYGPDGGPRSDALPGGMCPKHNRAWKSGRYGWYCSARDDSEEKGYCKARPTKAWEAANER